LFSCPTKTFRKQAKVVLILWIFFYHRVVVIDGCTFRRISHIFEWCNFLSVNIMLRAHVHLVSTWEN
ncbi:unnamed protein product, partial [Tenebrio molitor]